MLGPSHLKKYYSELDDDALVAAYQEGHAAYEAEAWAIVQNEFISRGLSLPNPQAAESHAPVSVSSEPVMRTSDREAALKLARRQQRQGTWWVFGGLVVTVGTFALAEQGGGYLIAWGAIAYGMIRSIKAENRIKQLHAMRLADDPGTAEVAV